MVDQSRTLPELSIPFPIPQSFSDQASSYAIQYFIPSVQQRIYLNTLAVLVADAYFRLLGFTTNLTKPERWNALSRLWSEANELELVGLGTLECQAIAAGQQSIALPLENFSDPIGYLFIEIASSRKSAMLVGFLPTVETELSDEEIAIADLQSMDALIDYLAQQEALSRTETAQSIDLVQEFSEKRITYLRNWLNNIYAADWEPSMRDLRTATCKKKLQLAGQTFDLQLSVSQSEDGSILVRIIVQSESASLPRGMQVSVPDESEIYTETVNETADLISIPLELSPGEEFWIELRLGESVSREYFVA
jgi:Protein of unknown function (DUF1822)